MIELCSETDSLPTLQAKMQEYMANGVRLGWLINPQDKQVEVHRLEQPVEVLENPSLVSGESVLPGFVLSLSRLLEVNLCLPRFLRLRSLDYNGKIEKIFSLYH